MIDISTLVRNNIKSLSPYSSARDEYSGSASVFLDANENPFNAPYNRYPDPMQQDLKQKVSELKGVAVENIFLGNGSDEAIDLLFRVFCNPGEDNVIIPVPTYGMYGVCAEINDVEMINIPLTPDFNLNVKAIFQAVNENSKMMFICSPNNPSGNCFCYEDILACVRSFKGIVVIDEAYIDFCPEESWVKELSMYNNVVILQTFSKAWGMAGIRLGMAFASKEIISFMNKVKYPYNLNILTQQKGLELLDNKANFDNWVSDILSERAKLEKQLSNINGVQKIYPSDANFLLVKINDARLIYDKLVAEGVIVRDRSKVVLCDNCLRITIGSKDENKLLLDTLKSINI